MSSHSHGNTNFMMKKQNFSYQIYTVDHSLLPSTFMILSDKQNDRGQSHYIPLRVEPEDETGSFSCTW